MANVPHFVMYVDAAGRYRWRFVAGNGEIIADSGQGYITKAACLNGINLVKKYAPTAPVVDATRR